MPGRGAVHRRISTVNPGLLVPAIFLVVVFAAYQVHTVWDDIVLMLLIGIVGVVLYSRRWPRAPVLIGFVLGSKVEATLRISLDRYGFSWLDDPIVLAMGAVLVAIVAGGIAVSIREVRANRALVAARVGGGTGGADEERHLPAPEVAAEPRIRKAPTVYWIGWLALLILAIGLFGMAIGGALWLVAFLRLEVAVRWRRIGFYLAGYAAVIYLLTDVVGTQFPTSWFFVL